MGLKQFVNNITALFSDEIENITSEVTTNKSPYWADSYIEPYNPNSLARKKGLEIYSKMESDDQVKACLDIKKRLILSRGFDILTDGTSEKEIEARQFIEDNFNNMFKGLFITSLYEMLSAIQYGFSVTEKIHKVMDTGRYKGKIVLDYLKTRPPHSFEFPQDDFGNVTIKQNQPNSSGVIIPSQKVLLYSYKKEFGNPFGKSDLNSAYRAWFFKDMAIRSWAIFNERHGVPIAVGKYGRLPEKAALLTALKRIQTNTSIVVPKESDVSILDSNNRGEALVKAIEFADIMISRSLLIPELLGFSTHTTGSQALGREQFQLFYMTAIESPQQEIAENIDENIIKELCDINFGQLDNYPYFRFKTISDAEKVTLIDNLVKLVEKGVILPNEKDEEFVRKELGLPEIDIEKLKAQKGKNEIDKISQPIVPRETDEGNIPAEKVMPIDNKESADSKFGEDKILKRPKTIYEEKTNFAEITKTLDNLGIETAQKMGSIMIEIKNRIINHVRKNRIIDDKKYKEIEDIRINPMYLNELQGVWQTQLRKAFKDAQKTAKNEIRSTANFAVEMPLNQLPPAAALDYIERQALRIKNLTNDEVLKGAKNILYAGIENGQTTSQIIYKLEEFFSEYETMQKVAVKTKSGNIAIKEMPVEMIPGRLETIVRTNIMKAYNEGRWTEYFDPGLKGFVEAVQYSAIMDDRTTPYCIAMDGLILDTNDPDTKGLMPPAHFNCRSTTIAVTADEKYTLATAGEIAEARKYGPAEGFGG